MGTIIRKTVFATAAATGLVAGAASAQNLITSNTTIHNSLCVGFDCATSESYGSDTIRLKENNLRIHFDDTSAAASFPNQDWRIEINSNVNGGGEYFRVVDATASRNIFTLEAAAPSSSLVVDNGGRVGFGTDNPAVELHTVDGDTPTLRLAQDGSSGFAPQSWDLAGNETSFFIRDVTNGSTLPFRIRPGAPSQALVIDTDGDVGIGTLTSDAALHVKRTAAGVREMLRLDNNGGSYITLANSATSEEWYFTHENNAPHRFLISHSDGLLPMALDRDGNMVLTGDLTTTGSVCASGCDRVFDADYPLPTIKQQAEMMFAERHLPNVGPTDEDGPFNVTQKVAGMLNELEKAHIYIAQLEDRLAAVESRLITSD
ncbi:hypothetical protein [Tropicibacter oceani]|uniref:Tail fiber domain-containing protein n=1 Tax=Tropicibacter oceani TaxID=3058420 RepID=A0ABY8QPS4_9RHOB|nr:hypothetical protein [Tropicibacter oceani]WGW06053.1 hypothetical protein QF118_19780 [Tropicibacter oceani]